MLRESISTAETLNNKTDVSLHVFVIELRSVRKSMREHNIETFVVDI